MELKKNVCLQLVLMINVFTFILVVITIDGYREKERFTSSPVGGFIFPNNEGIINNKFHNKTKRIIHG